MALKKDTFDDFPEPKERYVLEDCLGCGAFGKVFAATDAEASNKRVAIKVLKLHENTKVFVEQEYKILRDLSCHVNLPDFYGVYRKEEELWFVMEICEEGPVSDLVEGLLAQNRRISEEHIAYILKETVKAVIFLHEKCLIHRDIRAKNILLTRNGEVKLADFGFGVCLEERFGKIDGVVGSPCWMAPEIITCKRRREKYDNRVDVWSLGITAIELGDGKAPFQDMHPTRTLFQIVTNPPPALYRTYNWSGNYLDFIDECLVKNPEHRPFAIELLEHPFLSQIPDNNYHLSLELKALLIDLNKLDLPKAVEVAVIETFLKYGNDGDLQPMLLEDLAALDHISEKNVLKLLEARMESGLFHTFIGDVLLVLNPFEKIALFGDLYHQKYRLKSRSDNAPHIYTVADSAYQYALHHQIPQKILLSGESGSGKTKSYLHIINHLLFLGQNDNINIDRITDGIKLIHSLTHASTPINSYSTRCVFKTDIKYGTTGKVSGAIFNVYQLEKWRISSVDMLQGNYHFLYYIYDGLCENKKLDQYHLNSDCQYRYLRIDDSPKNSPKCNINQNLAKFKKLLKIFENFDLGYDEMATIFSIVAAILITGEIRFQESETGSAIIENRDTVEKIGLLLKIDPKKFEWALTNYCVVRKGTAVRKRSTVDEARDARDVIANNLYARLVDYLVPLVNYKLSVGRAIFGEKYSVQVFDYFGFESVKINHLSQLFVNCLNEQLQYYYLQRLFSWEYLDIKEEALEYQPFSYYDNKKTLDELLGKPYGLFALIDDSSKTGRDAKYIIDCLQNVKTEFINVIGESEFCVSHYTGKVTYCVTEMPEKNRDFLPPEVTETLRLSDNSIIKTLFTNKLSNTGNLMVFDKESEKSTKRYKFRSSKPATNQYSQIHRMKTSIQTFKAFSLEVLRELSSGSGSGGTHFVRCLRTNLNNEPQNFDYQLIKHQVRALAVTETAKARQWGYSHRITFQEFLRRYQFLAFDFNESVEVSKENCRLLLIRLKMEGWSIGKSKVFLKYYHEEYLTRLYETQVKKIIKIQSILRRFLAKCLVAKQITNREKSCISTIGSTKPHRMTEEEAAAIIQKAYRDSTIRKSYPHFAKDYQVLDEETCDFIRSYANKWRRNTIFHVLVLYRAFTFQEMFNFTQQVHLYNIGVFYELQINNTKVPVELIDTTAQVSNWLEESKMPLRKIPFRLDEIPFYETWEMSNHLTNSGLSFEKEELWDSPYRWRELPSFKTIESTNEITRNENNLVKVPYIRDSLIPLEEVPEVIDTDVDNKQKSDVKIFVDESFSKKEKEEENQILKKIADEARIVLEKKLLDESIRKDSRSSNISMDTKPANKDFDYIKPPIKNKPKVADPVAELRKIGLKNVSEDDPPFNFQGMLRKTNFQKEPVKSTSNVPIYSLKKRCTRDDMNQSEEEDAKNKKNIEVEEKIETISRVIGESGLIEKRVKVEIAPGIIIDGIEVDL